MEKCLSSLNLDLNEKFLISNSRNIVYVEVIGNVVNSEFDIEIELIVIQIRKWQVFSQTVQTADGCKGFCHDNHILFCLTCCILCEPSLNTDHKVEHCSIP